MSKKKLYFVLLIFFITATLVGTQNASAHQPYSMNLSYNTNPSSITVGISHSVDDPNVHYISKVEVEVNDTLVITETYTSQPTANNFYYTYNITASTNDKVKVTATCNQEGSASVCLIIGVGSCPTDGGPQIPGYFGLWVVVGISVMIFLTLIHRKLRNNITQT